jgi:hypothetical protein
LENDGTQNKAILTNVSSTPFYILGYANPSCGLILENEPCVHFFIVNATGIGKYNFFDLGISNETTSNSQIEIITIN